MELPSRISTMPPSTSSAPPSPSVDVALRILGSVLVIAAYFIILHVNMTTGIVINVIADSISIPYFIRTKSWDVVIMIVFLLTISVSKFI